MPPDLGRRAWLLREPDHVFVASLSNASLAIENVPCSIFRPSADGEKPLCIFTVTGSQAMALLQSFEFSANGQPERQGGVSFEADVMYPLELYPGYRSPEDICKLLAEPRQLTLRFPTEGSSEARGNGIFWITHSTLVNPFVLRILEADGSATVRTGPRPQVSFGSHSFRFSRYYREEEGADHRRYTTWRVGAEAVIDGPSDANVALHAFDDVMLLASLAQRHRSICYRFDWPMGDLDSKTLLCNRQIPNWEGSAFRDTLVNPEDFQWFWDTAALANYRAAFATAIRSAINALLSSQDADIEGGFVTLFSALETLISHFNGAKRSGRFSDAAKLFVTAYGIRLSDLWPLYDKQSGVSLYEIRNSLVHRRDELPNRPDCLVVASLHLRWLLERSIVQVLGVDIERTRLKAASLAQYRHYADWHSQRAALSAKRFASLVRVPD